MTTMATETTTFTRGQQVRVVEPGTSRGFVSIGQVVEFREDTDSECCGGAHRYSIRDTDGDAWGVAEVAPLAAPTTPVPIHVKPDMPMGARLRLTNVATGASLETTVTGTFPADDFGVTVADSLAPLVGSVGRTLGSQWVQTGQVTVERLDTPAGDTPADSRMFAIGDRVRISSADAARARGVAGPDWCGTNAGRTGVLERQDPGFVGLGEREIWTMRFDDSGSAMSVYLGYIEHENPPVAARDFHVGDRIVVATCAEVAAREHMNGSSSSVHGPGLGDRYVGRRGVITDGGADVYYGGNPEARIWNISLDDGSLYNTAVWQSHINPDAEATEPPRRPGEIRVGDRVRLIGRGHPNCPTGSMGTVTEAPLPYSTTFFAQMDGRPDGGARGNGVFALDTREGVWQAELVTEAAAPATVQVGSEVRIVGGVYAGSTGRVVRMTEVYTYVSNAVYGTFRTVHSNVVLANAGATTPAAAPAYVDPMPPGQRVSNTAGRMGTVVSFGDTRVTDEQRRRYGTRPDLVAVVRDATPGQVNFEYREYLTVMADISDLDDSAKLRLLQVMIHRVASFEAVQRDWCDQVNTALARLGDLLPEDLRQVDRALGRRLTAATVFTLDGLTIPNASAAEVDDDDDEDDTEEVDRDFTVCVDADYLTSNGWEVNGVHLSVPFTAAVRVDADGDVDGLPDPSLYVDNYTVESAIDSGTDCEGNDIPGISSSRDVRRFTIRPGTVDEV